MLAGIVLKTIFLAEIEIPKKKFFSGSRFFQKLFSGFFA